MDEEIKKLKNEFELRVITLKRGLLNEIRQEYKRLIGNMSPEILKLPIMALKSLQSNKTKAEDSLKTVNKENVIQQDLNLKDSSFSSCLINTRKKLLKKASGRKKIIREASIIGQSVIMEDMEHQNYLLNSKKKVLPKKKTASKPPFAISVNDNSILIDKVDISSKDPKTVGNLIKDIQDILKKHYKN